MSKKAILYGILGALAAFALFVFVPWSMVPWRQIFSITGKTMLGITGGFVLGLAALWIVKEKVNISRLMVWGWFGFVLGELVYQWPTLARVNPHLQLLAQFGALGLAALALGPCLRSLDTYEAAMITLFGFPMRSVGKGICLIFQPFGIPVEKIGDIVNVEKTSINDIKLRAETGGVTASGVDKDYVDLEITFEYRPDPSRLFEYLGFNPEKREQTLKDQLERLMSAAIERRPNLDRVYADLEPESEGTLSIADEVLRDYKKIAPRYGIIPEVVEIDDPQVPEEKLKAKIERDNMKAKAEAEVEVEKQENKKKTLKSRNREQRANRKVAQAEKLGQKLTYEIAYRLTMAEDGMVKVEEAVKGLDRNTLEFLKDTFPAIAELLAALKKGPPAKDDPAPVAQVIGYDTPRSGFDEFKKRKGE